MGIPAHVARPTQSTQKHLALGGGAEARVPAARTGRCGGLTCLLLSAEGPWAGAADRLPVSHHVRRCPGPVPVCVHRPDRNPVRVCVWLLPWLSAECGGTRLDVALTLGQLSSRGRTGGAFVVGVRHGRALRHGPRTG